MPKDLRPLGGRSRARGHASLLVRFVAVGFLLLSSAVAPGRAAGLTVDHLRHWTGPEHTRVVLDLSGPPIYKERRSSDPPFVVLELEAQAGPGASSLSVGDGRL